MDNQNNFVLDKSIIETSSAWKDGYGFRRKLNGEFETVSYLPGSTLRVWLNKEDLAYAKHWHPEIEIIVPIENIYTTEINGITYILQPGDILIIPSGAVHELVAPDNGKRVIMLFDISPLSKISGFSFWMSFFSDPVIINKHNCPSIYHESKDLVNKLCHDYFDNDMQRDILFYSDIMRLFANYVQYQNRSNTQYATQDSDSSTHSREIIFKLNIVYDYISEHISESLDLESVADIAGFSKFHFSRLFKKYSGYNYYDYLCMQRIKAAETFLYDSKLSITEVALSSGFDSLSTFNRTFKKIKGCTPTQFRKLI